MVNSPLDLDAIEARANNAPSGPWFTHGGWPGRVFSDDEFNAHIARVTGTRANASAEFIAAARTDVPALVAEVRRLTAELQQTRQQLAAGPTPGIQYPSMGDAMGAAMAHNARMAANLHHNRPAPSGA